MIKPEATVTIGGKAVLLRVPLEGLEELGEIDPRLGELARRSAAWNDAHVPEVGRVLEIGLRHGGSGCTVDDVYAAGRWPLMLELALKVLSIPFQGVEPGEEDAAGEPSGSA